VRFIVDDDVEITNAFNRLNFSKALYTDVYYIHNSYCSAGVCAYRPKMQLGFIQTYLFNIVAHTLIVVSASYGEVASSSLAHCTVEYCPGL